MKASIMGIEFIMCDCYIDQYHKIGDDSIEYKCGNIAKRSFKINNYEHHICDVCLEIWKNEPERISFDIEIEMETKELK